MSEPQVKKKRRLLTSLLLRSPTARSAGALAFCNFGAMVLRLLGGLYLVKLLAPDELGTINAISLVLVYSSFLQAGMVQGINRELPYMLGQGKKAEAFSLASCAFAWILGCAAVTSVGALVWAGWETLNGRWDLAQGWAAHVVLLLLMLPGRYLEATFRTSSEFTKLGASKLIGGGISFALLLLVWQGGYTGQCLRLALGACAAFGLLWMWRPVRVRPAFRWQRFWHLFKVGMPLFGVGYLSVAWTNLDRVMIVRSLGRAPLGYYQIAILARMAGMSIILALCQVVYPRMSHMYGQTHDARKALRWVWRPTLVLVAGSAPLLVAGWFLVGPVMKWFLPPKYLPGIPAARWTLVILFVSTFRPPLYIFSVLRRQVTYAITILTGAAVFLLVLPVLQRINEDPLVPYVQAMALGTAAFVGMANLVAIYITRPRPGATGPPDTAPGPAESTSDE